jgi:D-alanine transaminase
MNVMFKIGGAVITPELTGSVLPGITRKHLLALAGEHGVPVAEEPFSMVELMNADEVIVTSSSALCMRVESIDRIPVGGKDPQRLKMLQDAYLEKFRRETTPVG